MSGLYFLVQNCKSAILKKIKTKEPLYDDNCGCPKGYTKVDKSTCKKIDEKPASFTNDETRLIKKADGLLNYCNRDTYYYSIENKTPIEHQYPNKIVDKNNVQLTDNVMPNSALFESGGSALNGRQNNIGISIDNFNNKWWGVTKCFIADDKKKICIGLSADNGIRVFLNSKKIIELSTNVQDVFLHWRIFEIEVNAGDNFFNFEGINYSLSQSIAFEVYDCDLSTLKSQATLNDVLNLVAFDSSDWIGEYATYLNGEYAYSCPDGYKLSNCDGLSCVKIDTVNAEPCQPQVIKLDNNCDCWQVIEEVEIFATEESEVTGKFENCEECSDTSSCPDSDRTRTTAVRIQPPKQAIPPDKGFKECCYDNIVFADLNDNALYKNDFNGFYFQKQLSSDTCDFYLVSSGGSEWKLDGSTYGDLFDFGTFAENQNLKIFELSWRKVLQNEGVGHYRIEKRIKMAGLDITIKSNCYHLLPFSTERADGTIRLDTLINGKMIGLGVNFAKSEFKDSLRIPGFFGRREPKMETDYVVHRNYEQEQISAQQTNIYSMESHLLPEGISKILYDFILFGDVISLNDYNLSNNRYDYKDFKCLLDSIDAPEYFGGSRNLVAKVKFKDWKENNRKINC